MNFIRGSLLVFISALLLISFLVLGIFATLNSSLEYEIVKPQIQSFIKEIVEKEINKNVIDNQVEILQTHCKNNSEYTFDDESTNHVFTISCETIANGTNEIINKESALLIDEYYSKNYECEFWKCFKEEEKPFFLVSQYAKDYWKGKYYTFLFISILLAGLIFLLVEKKNNFPILTGSLLISGFLPLIALSEISKFAFSSLTSEISFNLNSIVLIFFSKSNSIFLTGLIIGAILIGIGILLKALEIGIEVEEWIEGKDDEKKE